MNKKSIFFVTGIIISSVAAVIGTVKYVDYAKQEWLHKGFKNGHDAGMTEAHEAAGAVICKISADYNSLLREYNELSDSCDKKLKEHFEEKNSAKKAEKQKKSKKCEA